MNDTPETPAPEGRARWMRDARWGVCCHYLADSASASAIPDAMDSVAWNARIDGFDADTFAVQLASVGAGYVIFSLGQNSGYYCAPNAAYDEITGIRPSKLSRRDLIADLAAALAPRGVRLLVYLPCGAPENDPAAVAAFQWHRGYHGPGYHENPTGERLAAFQELWERVVREWALRWGDTIAGWWIDGVYFSKGMYRHPTAPNFASLLAALRAGHPGAAVALNDGVQPRIGTLAGSGEDFTAGEADFSLPLNGRGVLRAGIDLPGGGQHHVLSFLGEWWGEGQPRFPDELVAGYTQHINTLGGAVTWDVPISAEGKVSPAFLRQLARLAARD